MSVRKFIKSNATCYVSLEAHCHRLDYNCCIGNNKQLWVYAGWKYID